ncbi:MAG TPA: phasin family protein [Pseudolabrys sp.]|jgi:phasin|nr:phasin family protein [Pseudolabrys sp.]
MASDNSRFDMPAEMRAFAEKGLEQAKTAFDAFATAAQQAAAATQTQVMSAQSGARELGQLALRYTERNISSSFEFAHKLMHAKDAGEVAALHTDYVSSQMAALSEQAHELGRRAGKMGAAPTSH